MCKYLFYSPETVNEHDCIFTHHALIVFLCTVAIWTLHVVHIMYCSILRFIIIIFLIVLIIDWQKSFKIYPKKVVMLLLITVISFYSTVYLWLLVSSFCSWMQMMQTWNLMMRMTKLTPKHHWTSFLSLESEPPWIHFTVCITWESFAYIF